MNKGIEIRMSWLISLRKSVPVMSGAVAKLIFLSRGKNLARLQLC